ncbi:MAG: glycoside hydrolase [Flavobacteriales bacterium]|nr:glycoside hydrolase [Flavobacteriales bacterium]
MNFKLFMLSLVLSTGMLNCAKDKDVEHALYEKKSPSFFNGASFVGPRNQIEGTAMDPLEEISCNAVTLMPFGFITAPSAKISWNTNWQWWGEKKVGIAKCIEFAHDRGLHVMVKPQVWISSGGWMNSFFTGDYEMNSESEWEELEDYYFDFIMEYARVAESNNAEAFCIGTEWKKFFQNRPIFWSQLIDSCRSVFSGQMTYAGNWDSYKFFPHWDKLDFIGIDAYFPVSDAQTPTVQQCLDGWNNPFEEIKNLSLTVERPVIFTEYGYRNIDYTGKEPWFSGSAESNNTQAQINAYEALYRKFWNESWFMGGYLWKWFDAHDQVGGHSDNYFTPQNKPVIETIKKYYSE